MNKTHLKTVFSLVALLLAGLLSACNGWASIQKPAPTPRASLENNSKATIVIAEGRLMPKNDANLFFTTGGQVTEILVEEGDQVTSGQVLARLGERETVQASLAAAELESLSAQQDYDTLLAKADLAYNQASLDVLQAERAHIWTQEALDKIDTGEHQEKIDKARLQVEEAKDDLEDAEDDYDKYRDMDPDQADRKRAEDELEKARDDYDQAVRERDLLINELEQAKTEVEMAANSLEEARQTEADRRSGPDPDDLALVEARLNNARAQVAAAQAALDKLDLKAPFSGTIVKVNFTGGERVLANQVIIVIADFSQWFVETTDLNENDVVNIQVGQGVELIPDALPDLAIAGVVESISDTYLEKAGDVTYTARIRLEDVDRRLRWGMTCQVEFPIEVNSSK